MTIHFNADEIFEIAEQIENNGARFYRRAAQGKDEKTQQLLLDLAGMEETHFATFEKLREALTKLEWRPSGDADGQSVQYLRSIADGHIFDAKADPAAKLTGDETLADILNIAIKLEKDSVIFYQELRQIVPERLGKFRIDHIVGEEMRHIVALSEQLAALKPKP
ncbi:MAG TPA: ferritin family protein [Planctomycetota bacterium]|nr:ferritin family protein [Planctomycetota bacterium]